jgi:WD40 repeat protein
MVVFVYDTSTWEVYRHLTSHKGSVLCLDWSHDGTRLASGSGRDKVVPNGIGENVTIIWEVESAAVVMRLEGHTDGVLGVAWSPDDALIATASDDRTARVWNPETGEEVTRLEGHTSGTLDCAWSPNGSLLVTGSRDYKARLWDLGSNLSLGRWSDNNCVRSVEWHPAGDLIATSGVDRTLKFRNSTTGSVQWTIDDGLDLESIVMKSRWSPNGDLIVSAYGKAATIIMYGDVGRQVDGDGDEPYLSALAVLVVAALGCALILYPAMVKIRRRRG